MTGPASPHAMPPARGGHRGRRGAALGAVVAAVVATLVAGGARAGDAACDVDAIGAAAGSAFHHARVVGVEARRGVVTLLLGSPGQVGTLALALYDTGSQLYTSQMAVRLRDEDRAAISREVSALFDDAELRPLLRACSAAASFADDPGRARALNDAIEAALAAYDRGAGRESPGAPEAALVVGALLAGLVLAAWPWRAGGRAALAALLPPPVDAALLLAVAGVGAGVALRIASQMTAEIDEVVTLAARHEDFAYLVSWQSGGEPFNPPAAATLFAAWLRVAHGFFAARLLAIALIPLTALAAYRAGANLAGRAAGVVCAAMIVWAPGYLRFAAIARAYALIALVLCLLLAAIFGTHRRPSRGVAVGVAGVCALWVSYLLWPLAFAAPWLARLARRDRVRLTLALVVVAAALVPRVLAGTPDAQARVGMFELAGPLDALGQALASAAQASPPSLPVLPPEPRGAAVALGAALLGIAAAQWRRRPGALAAQLVVVAAVGLPLAALLAGGHGIRDRHALPLHLACAWIAAGGLGLLLATPTLRARALAVGLLLALATLAWRGDATVLAVTADWPPEIARRARDADVIVIVPAWADGPVQAMLFGVAPEGSDTAVLPPVCPLGTERACRRIGGVRTVAVDQPTAELARAVAAAPRSLWIFDSAHLDTGGALQSCERFVATPMWTAFECRAGALRPE